MTRALAPPADEVGSVGWMTTILAKLRKHPDAQPFLKPVDWKRMGLNDYPKVIKTPMDLQTAGRLCRDGQYSSVDAFRSDIARIWQNCRTYNGSNSEIASMADRMEAFAEGLFAEGIGDTANPTPAAADEEEISKSKRRRRAAAVQPAEDSDSNNIPRTTTRGRPPGSKSKKNAAATEPLPQEHPPTTVLTPQVAEPSPPPPAAELPMTTTYTDGQEESILHQQPLSSVTPMVRVSTAASSQMTEHRTRILQKFAERVARLNPKNMYYFLSTMKEEWLCRTDPQRVELDLSLIDDDQISSLTSVCKCLLYYQTVAS